MSGWIACGVVAAYCLYRGYLIRCGLRRIVAELLLLQTAVNDETQVARIIARDSEALVERFRKACENN